jgi:HD superfamily phosphohydrolase
MDFGNAEDLKKILKAIIDTKSFQRLRRISQLGLASYVFPGATHSRFSHSLGASYLATLVLRKISEQDHKIEFEVNKYFNSIVVSALLHDVGHGPFSHSFENVLDHLKDEFKIKKIPLHEDWTAEIIKNKKSEIFSALKKNKLNPAMVSSPFVKDPKLKYPTYLKQIVSSQIDVDRMDYLLRDSHFSGVTIGKFDLNYLINCLQVVSHTANKPKTLGLYYKGVKPYEAYLISRQLMNKSVYFHRKVKIAEYMAESIFEYLIKKEIAGRKNPSLPPYLKLVAKNLKQGRIENDSFMNEALEDYISLTEDDFWFNVKQIAMSKGEKLEQQYARKLLSRDILDSFLINPGKETVCSEVLKNEGFRDGIDYKILETKTRMYKQASAESVFVKSSDDNINEISSFSPIINALSNKDECEKILVLLKDDKLAKKKIEKLVKHNHLCFF